MNSALVVGGTGFVGRHTVAELLAHGYEVTTLSRGAHGFTFADSAPVEHVTGDRADEETLESAAQRADPDLVVDCAAYYPEDVRTALDVFADVDSYVYVSSGAVYRVQEIPKREDQTPLHDCTAEQATDDSMATYGPRKAECDRIVTAAADRGIPGKSVRPTVVYGPQTVPPADDGPAGEAGWSAEDHASWADDVTVSWVADDPGIQTHHDYWIDRISRYDRVVVPGDGTAIWHRAYVEDVASAIRLVAEDGDPGEAYNVGDRRVCTIGDVVELIADALDTSVEVVHASRRELARVDLDPNDFVLYHHPMSEYPHVLDTCKLASLGWASTPVERAMTRTVAESVASGRTGSVHDPGRDAEERVLAALSD